MGLWLEELAQHAFTVMANCTLGNNSVAIFSGARLLALVLSIIMTHQLEGCGLTQCITYGRADQRENDAISFEQSAFSKIHESNILQLSC